MTSQVRRVLGEKDVNIPLTSPTKQWATKKPSSGVDGTLHVPPTVDNGLSKNGDTSENVAPSPTAEHSLNMGPVSPSTDEPANTATVLHTTSVKRPRSDEDEEEEQGKQARRRLGSPFSEDVVTPITRSQPTPLTEDRIASLQQPPPVARSFSVSPTLVDSTTEPSAAELLRTRLRFAMFKIRTDQTTAPFSKLEICSPAAGPKPRLSVQDPPEETMRAFRRKTRGRHGPSVASRLLGPIGRIVPGTAHMSHAPQIRTAASACSSPSAPASPQDGEEALPSTENAPATPSSAGGCESRFADHEEPQSNPEARRYGPITMHDKDLTSSAVKDRAADSLLQLGGERP